MKMRAFPHDTVVEIDQRQFSWLVLGLGHDKRLAAIDTGQTVHLCIV